MPPSSKTDPMTTRTPPGPPPTVASLKAMGVTGAVVGCTNCRRDKILSFEALGVADDLAFPMIARMKLVCSHCGAAAPTVIPDWSGYRPSGGG